MGKTTLSVSVDEEEAERIKNDPTMSQTEIFEAGLEQKRRQEKGDLEQFKQQLEELQEEKEELESQLSNVEESISEVQENINQLQEAQSAEVTAMVEIQREMFSEGLDYDARKKEHTVPTNIIEGVRQDMIDETGEIIDTEDIKQCYQDIVKEMDEFDSTKVDSWVQNNL